MKHSHPTLRQTRAIIPFESLRPVSTITETSVPVTTVAMPVMARIIEDVSLVLVNYNTKRLTLECYESFRKFYPSIDFIIIDNGSNDGSEDMLLDLEGDNTFITLNGRNLSHGPALHKGIRIVDTEYVFTLDSDCIIKKHGFLEEMTKILKQSNKLYATGWLRWVNYNGVALDKQAEAKKSPAELEANFTPYIHPYAMLLNREMYLKLPPFSRRGAPCIDNMRAAKRQGYKVQEFPIEDYIEHLVAGTRRMYKGKWNPREGEEQQEWKKDKTFPI